MCGENTTVTRWCAEGVKTRACHKTEQSWFSPHPPTHPHRNHVSCAVAGRMQHLVGRQKSCRLEKGHFSRMCFSLERKLVRGVRREKEKALCSPLPCPPQPPPLTPCPPKRHFYFILFFWCHQGDWEFILHSELILRHGAGPSGGQCCHIFSSERSAAKLQVALGRWHFATPAKGAHEEETEDVVWVSQFMPFLLKMWGMDRLAFGAVAWTS